MQHASPTPTPEELREVADKMTRESYPAGTRVIGQGDSGDKFFLIKAGDVEVFVDGETDAHRVRVLGRGDFFGEMALLLDQPRSATVKAVGPVEFYTLGKEDFRAAIEASPPFKEQVSASISPPRQWVDGACMAETPARAIQASFPAAQANAPRSVATSAS